jgi:hypothetical protein
MKHSSIFLTLVLMTVGLTFAQTTPPDLLNYQGVLRDSSDEPLDGTYGMVFRFFSADSGGDEILVDAHGSVTVSGGMFNVQLGSGSVTDGSGPGEYTTLSRAFADYPDLHLEVEVGGETLSPRIRVVSAGYALNTRFVRGMEMVSDGPLDLYVDGITGDDNNDGLSPGTAKQTIQAAVNAVPAVLTGPATIHIADGTYHEQVTIVRSNVPILSLVGNETSPQNVVLDGQDTIDDTGIMVLGVAEIRGIEVTGFLEEGLEVNFGLMDVDNCRVIGNGTTGEYDGIGVFGARAGISNTVIAGSGDSGIEIEDGASNVHLSNVTIIGNTSHGIEVDDSSHVHFGGGTLLIQNNGGVGVRAKDGSSVDFNGESGLTIQANPGGSMQASYHSTIRGYGSGTTGSCSADGTSVCEP